MALVVTMLGALVWLAWWLSSLELFEAGDDVGYWIGVVGGVMMLLLFTPVIGAGATLGISVTMRVTSILGDGLAFLLGMVSLKMSPPPVQNHR
mgnify:CR=1 FL=1